MFLLREHNSFPPILCDSLCSPLKCIAASNNLQKGYNEQVYTVLDDSLNLVLPAMHSYT